MTRRAIGVSERPPLLQTIPLSLQHLFAMFGATVLVPVLFHINPATVLLFNGIGTLLYLFICKGKIPAYLGSSFAFISPVLLLLPLGYEVALGGFIMCGVLFCLVSFIVKKAGTGWLDVLFPPAAMGAIVAVIGLELAGVAAGMAGLLPAEGQTPDSKTIIISITTLAVTVLGSVLFRGFLAIIPILIGVLVGYALSFAMGIVDTTPIINAHWFALPTLYTPRFEWFAILTILPAALVVIAEHVGHLVVTANIVKKDLLRDPGLHRSMFANGLSTVISGFFGSTPNTTYGENIGVMAITRVYSTWVIGGGCRYPDDPIAGDGRRFAAALWCHRCFRYSCFDRIESGLQQSTEPDPDFRDFDHRRQWREGKHRRGGVKRYGAGDHRRYRLKFDLQTDQCAAP
jgi:uracil permease